ncbi:protein-export chaperone SecB [Thermoanaerobacterium thermosaccharolyticum]|uniref:protein-export chaperone SecB n=1 Tax=Thermoanaerobacterium thermosaccharolyticum TaxID=1517 RepID=UPI003D2C5AA6
MEDNYKEMIKNIELVNIYLSKLNCIRTSDHKKLLQGINVNFNHNFELGELRGDNFDCKASFNVKGIKEDLEILEINAEFIATYHLENASNIDKELIDKFVKINLPLNVWPYGRELISSMTVRMGLPPLILSTYKIV